jgi:hypothetical protein
MTPSNKQVKSATTKAPIYQLRVELRHIKPQIWRRFIVPGSISLPKLHVILQIVMGWQNYHLHAFSFGGTDYGEPDPDFADADSTMLNEARVRLDRALGDLTTFDYEYDFGDGWAHRIKVEDVLPPDPGLRWARCTAARNACPPEDVGGPYRYAEFLEAISDPSHDEHQMLRDWVGENFDPNACDLLLINQELAQIRL